MYANLALVSSCVVSLLVCLTKATSHNLERRAIPPGYSFVDCYLGSYLNNQPLADSGGYGNGGMTLEYCALVCGEKTYFGVSGERCLCGDDIVSAPFSVVPASSCHTPCNGNTRAGRDPDDQYCGGNGYTSIYRREEDFIQPTGLTYQPIGCYTQGSLTYTMLAGPNTLTLSLCEAMCGGFNYFSVDITSCICSDTLYSVAQLVSSESCSSPCPSDGTQVCGGGFDYISMYATTEIAACGTLDRDLRVRNPGFESGTAYWTLTASANAQWQVQTRLERYSGKRLARIVIRAFGQLTLSQSIPVCPGVAYVLSYHDNLYSGLPGGCSSRGTVDDVNVPFANVITGWSLRSAVFRPTGETAQLKVDVVCEGTMSVVFLDEIQFRPATVDEVD